MAMFRIMCYLINKWSRDMWNSLLKSKSLQAISGKNLIIIRVIQKTTDNNASFLWFLHSKAQIAQILWITILS